MDLPTDPNLLLSQTVTPPQEAGGGGKTDPAALRKVCQQFEAILFQQMFKEMRATVSDSGLLPKDGSVGMFRDLMDLQVSREMAKGAGGGMAEALYRQLNPGKKD